MSHPSKKKGYTFEVEVVKMARKHGLDAERAWGSDGRALGTHSGVDVLVAKPGEWKAGVFSIQCKRVASVAEKYKPSDGVSIQAFRPDRGETMAMMRLDDLLKLIAK